MNDLAEWNNVLTSHIFTSYWVRSACKPPLDVSAMLICPRESRVLQSRTKGGYRHSRLPLRLPCWRRTVDARQVVTELGRRIGWSVQNPSHRTFPLFLLNQSNRRMSSRTLFSAAATICHIVNTLLFAIVDGCVTSIFCVSEK